MIALPPSEAGGVNVTLPCAFPAVALTFVGAPGMVGAAVGVTAFEGDEAGPVPTEFVAVTVNVYEVPLVSPVTVIGLEAPLAVMPPGLEVAV